MEYPNEDVLPDQAAFAEKFDQEKYGSAVSMLTSLATDVNPLRGNNWRADFAYDKIYEAIDSLSQDIWTALERSNKPADYTPSGADHETF